MQAQSMFPALLATTVPVKLISHPLLAVPNTPVRSGKTSTTSRSASEARVATPFLNLF